VSATLPGYRQRGFFLVDEVGVRRLLFQSVDLRAQVRCNHGFLYSFHRQIGRVRRERSHAAAPKATTASDNADALMMRALRVEPSRLNKRELVNLCIWFMQSVKICRLNYSGTFYFF